MPSPTSQPNPDPTRFILMRPSHPGNVGAAARALRVMGFGRLVLVGDRGAELLQHPEARALASGATDVLDAAEVATDLVQALGDATVVAATAMTPRDFGPPTATPREGLATLATRAAAGERLALVFGEERFGLSNEDLYRCHLVLSIPTAPDYGSLNLAQAVQVLAYEWRMALGGHAVQARARPEPRASAQAVLGLVAHWQTVLEAIEFLNPQAPKKLVPRLTRLAHRAQLTEQEVHILRGIARAVEQASGAAQPLPPPAVTPGSKI